MQKKVEKGKSKKNLSLAYNVYDKLKEDHRKVEKIFQKLLKTTEEDIDERESLFSELNESLSAHAEAEEKIFYPVTEGDERTRKLTLEAHEEHDIVKTLLAQLSELDKASEVWGAKIQVLSELVNHHVQEEETKIFPKAKKVIPKEQSQSMAEEIEQEEELFKESA